MDPPVTENDQQRDRAAGYTPCPPVHAAWFLHPLALLDPARHAGHGRRTLAPRWTDEADR